MTVFLAYHAETCGISVFYNDRLCEEPFVLRWNGITIDTFNEFQLSGNREAAVFYWVVPGSHIDGGEFNTEERYFFHYSFRTGRLTLIDKAVVHYSDASSDYWNEWAMNHNPVGGFPGNYRRDYFFTKSCSALNYDGTQVFYQPTLDQLFIYTFGKNTREEMPMHYSEGADFMGNYLFYSTYGWEDRIDYELYDINEHRHYPEKFFWDQQLGYHYPLDFILDRFLVMEDEKTGTTLRDVYTGDEIKYTFNSRIVSSPGTFITGKENKIDGHTFEYLFEDYDRDLRVVSSREYIINLPETYKEIWAEFWGNHFYDGNVFTMIRFHTDYEEENAPRNLYIAYVFLPDGKIQRYTINQRFRESDEPIYYVLKSFFY